MKTVEQHNAERRENIKRGASPGTGIQCPKCGYELVNLAPGYLLASNPPQVRLDCPSCTEIVYCLA